MITSSQNQQIKNLIHLQKKAKARYEQRVFVVEGPNMCLEAPREKIRQLYVSESFISDPGNRERLRLYSYEVLTDQLLQTVSEIKTPQGILGLVEMPDHLPDMAQPFGGKAPLFLIAEGIQDPGNLGTMLRTGEAAGITGLIMDQDCADIFQPKAVRATMGSICRVPVLPAQDLPRTVRELKEWGLPIYAAHLQGSIPYDAADCRGGCAILIGNEGQGLSEELTALADAAVRIPMEGQVESLNAAVSAAILLYEAKRQIAN